MRPRSGVARTCAQQRALKARIRKGPCDRCGKAADVRGPEPVGRISTRSARKVAPPRPEPQSGKVSCPPFGASLGGRSIFRHSWGSARLPDTAIDPASKPIFQAPRRAELGRIGLEDQVSSESSECDPWEPPIGHCLSGRSSAGYWCDHGLCLSWGADREDGLQNAQLGNPNIKSVASRYGSCPESHQSQSQKRRFRYPSF